MKLRIHMIVLLAVAATFASFLVTPLYPPDENANGWPLAWYSRPDFGWIPWVGEWLSFLVGSFSIVGFSLDLGFWFGAIYVTTRLVAKENES